MMVGFTVRAHGGTVRKTHDKNMTNGFLFLPVHAIFLFVGR